MFVWVDTETTGLDYSGPFPDVMLELGILITDDNLNVEEGCSWVIFQPSLSMDDFVKNMHTKSGLLDQVYDQDVAQPLEDVQDQAMDFLRTHAAMQQPMCGSSIAFDRGMLERWMPELNASFHYRSIDVSSFKELFRRKFPDLAYPAVPDENKAHRAMDDILASVHEMRHYVRAIEGAL